MNLLNVKTDFCISKTNIGWIILDLRSKKVKVFQPQRTIERDWDLLPIELLTSENWLPIKNMDYFEIAPKLYRPLQDRYLDEKFGKYFKKL